MLLNQAELAHMTNLFAPSEEGSYVDEIITHSQLHSSLRIKLLEDAINCDTLTFLRRLDAVNGLAENQSLIHSLKIINNIYHNANINFLQREKKAISHFSMD